MDTPHFSCQEQLIPGKTYREKFEFLSKIGFSGIEIWSKNLQTHFDELIELRSSIGLRVSSGCQSFEGGLIDSNEPARQAAIGATIEALRCLSRLGAGGYVVPAGFALGSNVLPPYRPPRPPEEDRMALLDSLASILPEAEKLGVCIFLEPINRYETHYLHTLAEAAEIAAEINHPNVRVVADFFHMSMEEAHPDQVLCQYGNWIGHVHLADSNRKLPGQGHLDYPGHFSALQQAGFQGWMTVECDDPIDTESELPIASQFLYECWQRGGELMEETLRKPSH